MQRVQRCEDRGRVGLQHAINDAEFLNPRAGLGRVCGGDDFAGEPLCSRGARDRAADQAEADQRDASEDWRGILWESRLDRLKDVLDEE